MNRDKTLPIINRVGSHPTLLDFLLVNNSQIALGVRVTRLINCQSFRSLTEEGYLLADK